MRRRASTQRSRSPITLLYNGENPTTGRSAVVRSSTAAMAAGASALSSTSWQPFRCPTASASRAMASPYLPSQARPASLAPGGVDGSRAMSRTARAWRRTTGRRRSRRRTRSRSPPGPAPSRCPPRRRTSRTWLAPCSPSRTPPPPTSSARRSLRRRRHHRRRREAVVTARALQRWFSPLLCEIL